MSRHLEGPERFHIIFFTDFVIFVIDVAASKFYLKCIGSTSPSRSCKAVMTLRSWAVCGRSQLVMVTFALLISVRSIRDIVVCTMKRIGLKSATAASGYFDTMNYDGGSCTFNLLVILFLPIILIYL